MVISSLRKSGQVIDFDEMMPSKLTSTFRDSICLLLAALGAYKTAATLLFCYVMAKPFVVLVTHLILLQSIFKWFFFLAKVTLNMLHCYPLSQYFGIS